MYDFKVTLLIGAIAVIGGVFWMAFDDERTPKTVISLGLILMMGSSFGNLLSSRIVCPKCDTVAHNKNDVYCISCGELLPKQALEYECANCGSDLPEEAIFCPQCGMEVKEG